MGRQLQIDWQQTGIDLKELYLKERHTRLQALWQLSSGKGLKEVANLVGVASRPLQYWAARYRQGSLAELLSGIKGHGRQGRPAKLNILQQRALATKPALGGFPTVWDALHWGA
jgi:transposase